MSADARGSSSWTWRDITIFVYLVGSGLLALRLAIGTIKAQMLVRGASRGAGFLWSNCCAVPVTIGFWHPKVILPRQWLEWTTVQLEAVLAHERAHAGRRDPLVQWLALVNRAIFWFHPLAWWLERRLSALAEESCDDVVLQGCCDARHYAELLLEMARGVAKAGVRVNVRGMAMPGSHLAERIRMILEVRGRTRVSRVRLLGMSAACMISSVVFGAASLERVTPVPGLTPPPEPPVVAVPARRPLLLAQVRTTRARTLQNATIVINRSGEKESYGARILPNGRLVFRNMPLPKIIMEAYGVPGISFRAYGIRGPRPAAGEKDWCVSDRYDVTLDAAADTPEPEMRALLQMLLEQRFKLRVHIQDVSGNDAPELVVAVDHIEPLGWQE